ncbi:RING-H2 finger protein ATL2 [Punica granatum]|uniref:RING-type E3 ubiquitin transferase n=2 Tax=Punica granatum TaxID=22663 RepID=A0A218WPX6_PUNGR|nr:RING-H2 finger protein ATL2 [Punica granatum]OWM74052.1 hypothetical protein CDL15_Pgr008363 [Punica granatum]PKI48572.1 hypothetical protein CRG98_031037 [Punica granatum]
MSDFGDPDNELPRVSYSGPRDYALGGRIMLSAIIILFFVVLLMVFLHLYARWYLLRSRRRRQFLRRNRHNRRTHLVFYVEPVPAASRGLDSTVLRALPVFNYSAADGRREPLECAVCLSEFEKGEKARLLPKCGHSFHIDCIDMWFQSHSTCPLCRSPVEPVESPEAKSEPAASVSVSVPDPDPCSGLCAECQCDESVTARPGPSSSRRKPQELVGVSIEVPRRTEFDDESSCDSSASQYRSPMSRMLSFRRILSRDRRGSVSPSAASCAAADLDLERGREETHQQQG